MFGDLRAPIVFVGINPQHNPIDLAYDDLPRSDRGEALRRFREYALGKHGNLSEVDYRSTTFRSRNGHLRRAARELDIVHGKKLDLSIRRGAAFTANVVQCPTETIWGDIDLPKETKADIAQTCSDRFQVDILRELPNPKIIFFVGNDAFDWLKRRKEFARSKAQGDSRCDMD